MIAISLRPNNCVSNDPCALCGERCDPDGFDFFLGDSWALVCEDCAERHDPALYRRKWTVRGLCYPEGAQ